MGEDAKKQQEFNQVLVNKLDDQQAYMEEKLDMKMVPVMHENISVKS